MCFYLTEQDNHVIINTTDQLQEVPFIDHFLFANMNKQVCNGRENAQIKYLQRD